MDPSPSCPSCKTALPIGAVLCVSCGFDLRTGSKLPPPLISPSEGPAEAEETSQEGAGGLPPAGANGTVQWLTPQNSLSEAGASGTAKGPLSGPPRSRSARPNQEAGRRSRQADRPRPSRKCPNCHKEIEGWQVACANCGYRLRTSPGSHDVSREPARAPQKGLQDGFWNAINRPMDFKGGFSAWLTRGSGRPFAGIARSHWFQVSWYLLAALCSAVFTYSASLPWIEAYPKPQASPSDLGKKIGENAYLGTYEEDGRVKNVVMLVSRSNSSVQKRFTPTLFWAIAHGLLGGLCLLISLGAAHEVLRRKNHAPESDLPADDKKKPAKAEELGPVFLVFSFFSFLLFGIECAIDAFTTGLGNTQNEHLRDGFFIWLFSALALLSIIPLGWWFSYYSQRLKDDHRNLEKAKVPSEVP